MENDITLDNKCLSRFDLYDVIEEGRNEVKEKYGVEFKHDEIESIGLLIDYGIRLKYVNGLKDDYIHHYLFVKTSKLLLIRLTDDEEELENVLIGISYIVNKVFNSITLKKKSKFFKFWILTDPRRDGSYLAVADFISE